MCCEDRVDSPSDDFPNMPMAKIRMDHRAESEGEYTGSFTIVGGKGKVFVSAEVIGVGGIFGEYWPNTARDGAREICQTDS